MSLPKNLVLVTIDYEGDFECRGERYQNVAVYDLDELHEKVTKPELQTEIDSCAYSRHEIDFDDIDGFFWSNAWDNCVIEIENWGRNADIDTVCIDTEALTDKAINTLADWRNARITDIMINDTTFHNYAGEVFSNLTVATRRVATFLGKDVITYD